MRNVRIDTVSRMSTKVDPLTIYSSCLVDTVSGMSKAARGMSTYVDSYLLLNVYTLKLQGKCLLEVDGFWLT